MERDKVFFRHVLLHYFDLKKSVAEAHRLLEEGYGDQAPSHTTCKEWYRRFKCNDFDVSVTITLGHTLEKSSRKH